MPGTPMRELVGLSWLQTDHITRGTISHVRLICVQQTDMEKSILPNQSCQINLAKTKFGKINPSTSKFGKIDQCGTSQFIFYFGGTYTPSPTCHTPSPTHQK